MNVRTLCLSILHLGDATGYEIRRRSVEGECAYFVEASFGSIYPALARLEADGLVTSRVEPQEGKPARKVYSITEAGRSAFVDALFEPLGEDVFRSPFLLFARYAHLLPQTLVATRLAHKLEQLTSARERLEAFAAETPETPCDRWIVDFGLAAARVAETHMRTHMHELIALARPDAETRPGLAAQ